jgi:surfactin synthase thioesterase subunit
MHRTTTVGRVRQTRRVTGDSAQWIRRFRPAPDAAVRLVCLPHAGGSASFYLPVATALSPLVDVLAVQYPGRQDRLRDPLIDNIADLADAVTVALQPWLDRPFALFGHSMGASLGFEVALRLEGAGTPAAHLFVSGRRPPSRIRDEQLHLGDDDALIAELSRLAGTDSNILGDEELLRMVLPAIRNDYRAAETYRHDDAPPLAGPITVLTGDDDPRTSLDDATAWRPYTTAAFEVLVYPGGHFYLVENSAQVIDALSSRLRAGVRS